MGDKPIMGLSGASPFFNDFRNLKHTTHGILEK